MPVAGMLEYSNIGKNHCVISFLEADQRLCDNQIDRIGRSKFLRNTSLIASLRELEGNPKICVYTEPLWGIPFFLFSSYASLYMVELGVTAVQIGIILSLGMVVQVFSALLSGAITDKLGRRKTTFLFDFLSWSVPCLLWAFSQNFYWFLAAGLVNSTWRITSNSWACLLVEDAETEKLVHIFSLIFIAGTISAFFAPFAGFMVGKLGLILAVRMLYMAGFVLMSIKFVILYVKGPETRQGLIRLKETQNESIFSLLKGYGAVTKLMLKSRSTMICMLITAIIGISAMITASYWPLLITSKFGVPAKTVAMFPMIKSAIMLIWYFFAVPKLHVERFRIPLILGFFVYGISQLILFAVPPEGYFLLVLSLVLEAFSLATIKPLMESLIVVAVDARERARVMSIFWTAILAVSAPFGVIAGGLYDRNRLYPFILSIGIISIGLMLSMKLKFESS